MNQELQIQVDKWRQACSAGTMTSQEMADAIGFLRATRGEIAVKAVKKAPAAKKAANPDVAAALQAFFGKPPAPPAGA